ncbi:hypothetical protein KC726_03070 [Candidatus Woesebacteria bacterium]|nr:hypothetical protein [Candidatus Woesebacteria bacterium]
MSMKRLKEFLLAANRAGYAGGKEKQWKHEKDHSTTIVFEKGLWKSYDNFFGGEPYGGRSVVFYQNKPVWIMVYYGWVKKGEDTNKIYEILREALMLMPKDHPFRGPKEYKKGLYVYTNAWEGTMERFSGTEHIRAGDDEMYHASYMGGFVDQREGV